MKTRTYFGLLLLTLAAFASAETFRSLGKGDYLDNRDRTKITDAKITFNRSSFSLTLKLDNDRRIFIGGNSNGSGNRRNLQITDINGNDGASGSGTVTVEDGLLKKIDLSGSQKSGQFAVKYTGRDERPRDRDDDRWDDSSKSVAEGDTSGIGKYRAGSDENNFKKITFVLRENGTLIFTLKGNGMRETVFRGRWTGRGDTREFTLFAGERGKDITGNGMIHLSDDRKEIRTLNFNGRIEGERFSVTFKDK